MHTAVSMCVCMHVCETDREMLKIPVFEHSLTLRGIYYHGIKISTSLKFLLWCCHVPYVHDILMCRTYMRRSKVKAIYFLQWLSTFFFETRSRWTWYSLVSYTSSPLPTVLGWQVHPAIPTILWVLGIQTQLRMLTQQVLSDRAFPRPFTLISRREKRRLERWLRGEESRTVFQSTQVQFPAPTRQVTLSVTNIERVCSLFWPPWASGMHVVERWIYLQAKHPSSPK